jgi:uncharacterized membrane protein YfcA
MNSLVGFAKYAHAMHGSETTVDYGTIAVFAAVGIVGSLVGRRLNALLNPKILRRVFAVALLVLGFVFIAKEVVRFGESHTAKQSSEGISYVTELLL